jgi:hypothetical protein
MKPLQFLEPFAMWTMRIFVMLIIFLLQWPIIKVVNFQNHDDLLAFVYVFSGVLLLSGGFLRNSALTILSSILVFIITGYQLYVHFDATFSIQYLVYFWPLSTSLYFIARGNN